MSAPKQQKQNLWLKVTQGDMRTITCPQQLRKWVSVHQQQRLIEIDTFLLSLGTFAGRSGACHLRLTSMNDAPPQFCLCFDGRHRWDLIGLGGSVFVNGDLIGEDAIALNEDDQIICDPYILKVVQQPDPNALAQRPKTEHSQKTAPMSMSDTNFILNLPGTKSRPNGTDAMSADASFAS